MITLALLAVAAFQDTGALDRAVAAFTAAPIGVVGGPRAAIDTRLRLARCATVALSWRSDAHDAVVVTCGEPSWRIYVPVIAAPRTPTATVAATRVAAVPVVKAAPVIRRGDLVTIEAVADGFAITREGVAAGDAAPGERVAIKVADARGAMTQPVQAIAQSDGRATLPGWGE